MSWVLRWRMRKGVEVPVVEQAKGQDLKYGLGRATKREVLESTLRQHHKRLEETRQSLVRQEQYIAQLEKLLAKEPA